MNNRTNNHEHLERFIVFQGTPEGWVLRDTFTRTDYLFVTQFGAEAGRQLVLEGYELAGSPSRVNLYGFLPVEDTAVV